MHDHTMLASLHQSRSSSYLIARLTVMHARRNAEDAGVSDRAEFRQADIFATDFSKAGVVTMYLLPD